MVTVEIEAPAYGESCRQQRFPPTYGRRASCRLYREPCVGTREGVGEASVAVRMGRLLSIESSLIGSAEAVVAVEGNTGWTARVRGSRALRCQRTHARTYIWCRDLGGLALSPARAGALWERRNPYPTRGERKQSDSSIVVMKRANKEGELSAESVERRGGTKGNFGSPKYGPDSEPGCRDTGGGRIRRASRPAVTT